MKLISFLGRVPKSEKDGYRKTRYQFDDHSQTEAVSFIGWSLIERLKPESVVILGTSGSMWDHLLSSMSKEFDEELHVELLEQVEAKNVDQTQLNKFEAAFEQHLGIPCRLVIIPYGKNMDEQIQIMEIIAEQVDENQSVSLDVTHGFRHLPMLGLISAQYLQRLKKAKIIGIYYGMYDADLKHGEVYDLKGLLQLNNWVFALSQFDKDGDYGVFTAPLQQDGFAEQGINALKQAAYFERVFNVSKARQQLSTFKKVLGDELPGAGKLFTQALKDRVEWSNANNLQAHQRKLAHFYLDNHDFVRAAVFGVEAFITSLMLPDEKEYFHDDRYNAETAFIKDYTRGDSRKVGTYKDLKKIRNSLAHGSEAQEERERVILQDPEKLELHLRQLFKALSI